MVQLLEPWGANEPGGQQAAAPVCEEVPTGHTVQLLEPGGANELEGQELHAVAPGSKKVPGIHIEQVPDVAFR